MSSGVLGYHEMYITEIAECIRKIYVKQNEKKWVAWVQNGDIYFSPHTQEVLVVYNAVNPQPYKKALQSQYIGSVQSFCTATETLRSRNRPK